MSHNSLVGHIQTALKINKGLQVLEFASQFYLRRSYLRNCPLTQAANNNNNSNLTVHQQRADLVAELNQFLVNPVSGCQGFNHEPLFIKAESPLLEPVEKKKSNLKPPRQPDTHISYSIRQDFDNSIGQKPSLEKQRYDKNQPLPSTGGRKGRQTTSKGRPGNVKQSKINIPVSDCSSSSGGELSCPENSSRYSQISETEEEELPSYHSQSKKLTTIKEKSLEDSIPSPKHIPTFKGNQLIINKTSDLHPPLKDPKNSTLQKIPNPSQFTQACQFPSQISLKQSKGSSQLYSQILPEDQSFLDGSISQIRQARQQATLGDQNISQAEVELIRELSDSFADQENMKHLLQIENLEMEEKYLLNRMEKRLQTLSREIGNVRAISWKSLSMPTSELHFRRPSYAHCCDILK